MTTETTHDPGNPAPLERLAAAYGVATSVVAPDGTDRAVSASTLVAVLGAMGVAASSTEQVRRALDDADAREWLRTLPEAVVTVEGEERSIAVHVPDGESVEVWIELEHTEHHRPGDASRPSPVRLPLEQVDAWVEPRTVHGRTIGRATFALPTDLPTGWHVLRSRGPASDATAPLVVAPARLDTPLGPGEPRAWGFATQLYALRSRRSWGTGDLADLADLAWLAARESGADFLLVNPLHAAEVVAPMTVSPYRPSSRRFVNPLYVRVEEIVETAYLSAADRALVEWSFDAVRDLATDPGPVDRDAAWDAKRSALEVVHGAARSTARQAAFEEFRAREGSGLEDFATWCALTEHLGGSELPPAFGDPRSPAVAAKRAELATRVDFYAWLQWVADDQRETAQRTARAAGMRIGMVHDLAPGSEPGGADAWALGPILGRGVAVGVPPTAQAPEGLNHRQPPWDPWALARAGYRPLRDLLRTTLRHSGGLRVDDVLGLLRQWWIPGGARADAGTWVSTDHDAVLGVLCLEAQRAGAFVVGGELGVRNGLASDEERALLERRGILTATSAWSERTAEGEPLEEKKFPELALATVMPREVPPTAGYLAGEHVDARERLGLLSSDLVTARREAANERAVLVEALERRGLLGPDASEREIVEALHRSLQRTPSVLLGVSLADAVGERRAQHHGAGPGIDDASWRVPLADPRGAVVLLEDLFGSARLRSLAALMREG